MFVILVLFNPVPVEGFELTVLEHALVVRPAPLHPLKVLALHPHVAYATSNDFYQVDSLDMSGPATGGCKDLTAMLTRITLQRMGMGMFFQLLFCPEKLGTRHAFEGALMPFSVSPQRKVMVG